MIQEHEEFVKDGGRGGKQQKSFIFHETFIGGEIVLMKV